MRGYMRNGYKSHSRYATGNMHEYAYWCMNLSKELTIYHIIEIISHISASTYITYIYIYIFMHRFIFAASEGSSKRQGSYNRKNYYSKKPQNKDKGVTFCPHYTIKG